MILKEMVAQNNSRKDPKMEVTSVFRLRTSLPTGQAVVIFANKFKVTGKKAHNHITRIRYGKEKI